MNDDYKRLAYKKGIIEWEIRMLLEHLVDAENPAPEQLINEYVFYADRITPQDHLRGRLQELQQVVQKIDIQLGQFALKRIPHEPDTVESEPAPKPAS